MGIRWIFATLALCAAPAWAADFATCILDRAPKAQNDVAAQAVIQLCLAENPGGLQTVAQGSGRGWFGYKSGAECTAKEAVDTRSHQAAVIVGAACRKLYEPASFSYEEAFGLPAKR